MNLLTAIKKIPWKHRKEIFSIFQRVSSKIADNVFDNLSDEKYLEFTKINKYDKKQLNQFILDNVPDLENMVIKEALVYVEQKYGLN